MAYLKFYFLLILVCVFNCPAQSPLGTIIFTPSTITPLPINQPLHSFPPQLTHPNLPILRSKAFSKNDELTKELINLNKKIAGPIGSHKIGDILHIQDAIQNISKENPKHPQTALIQAFIYTHVNKPDSALIFFRKTIALDKKNLSLYKAIIPLLIYFEKYHEAKRSLRTALALAPYDPELTHLLSITHRELNEENANISLLKKALRHNPHHPYLLFNLGWIYIQNNSTRAKGITLLEKSWNHEPTSIVYGTNLALAYLANNQYNNAEILFNKLLSFNPQSVNSTRGLVTALYNRTSQFSTITSSELLQLENTIRSTLSHNPQNEDILLLLSFILNKKGAIAEAVSLGEQAYYLNERNVTAKMFLIDLYDKLHYHH